MAAPDSLCPGDAGCFQSGGGGMCPAALSEDRGMAVASGSMFAGVAADFDLGASFGKHSAAHPPHPAAGSGSGAAAAVPGDSHAGFGFSAVVFEAADPLDRGRRL